MRIRLLATALVLILFLSGSAAGFWILAPRLIQVTPAPGAKQTSKWAALQLEFNQPLAPDTAEQYLKITPSIAGNFTWQGNILTFMPDSPWQPGALVRVEMQRGARAARFPGLPLLQTFSWHFQVSQTRLAYLWPSDGPADLYALEPTSGDIQQLTKGEAILDYSFSKSGRWIYYSAEDGQGGSRIAQIDLSLLPNQPGQPYLPVPLIECPMASCRLVQPSPDDRWLVYERVPLQNPGSSTRSSIWIYSFQKQQSQQASAESHIAAYPAWSTSGLLAFYDSNLQAYQVIHPEQGQVLSFTNQTGKPGIWQPDSQGFVALEVLIETSGLLDPGGTSHLMHYALADSGIVLKDLSQAYDLEDKDPAFSPDGSKLAFSRRYLDPARWTPGRQLWVMHTDGSQAEPLTEEPAFHHYAFTWHPDGAQIAYVRFDPTLLTHPPELWLIDVDGSNPIQLVIGGFAPAWMP